MSLKLTLIPTNELLGEATARRDPRRGNTLTYSPKAFIPLTKLCRDRCGYCTFAKAPAKVPAPYMELEEVLDLARAAKTLGCSEALFTLGERPELRYPIALEWLRTRGFSSTIDYLATAMEAVIEKTGLLPHSNAGALRESELAHLRRSSVSQGMMLESGRAGLNAHRLSPDKTLKRRIETLESAGRLAIPFTTGLLIGIGEDEEDRIRDLEAIAEIHRRYGHIQEVIIQNFLPKAGTLMAKHPAAPQDTFQRAIALARIILPPEIHLQAPPNLTDEIERLTSAGIDDLGGISPITIDHVNPERPWPEVKALSDELGRLGFDLVPRLPIYPEFAIEPSRWVDDKLRTAVMHLSDSDGFAREHNWVSGGINTQLPDRLPRVTYAAHSAIDEIIDGVRLGQVPQNEEIAILFGARGAEVAKVANFADELRKQINGKAVTFVSNRNLNYTNICTFKCKFCAFSKGPLSLNLRGAPYLLSYDQIAEKVGEAAQMGATEVCLQGGIHPSFDASYYLRVLETVREAAPGIHIHAFSALEIFQGAKRAGLELTHYLQSLKQAGLKTLPGTAAEILDDEVRAVLCPDKLNTEQWLEVHERAHEVGLRSNVTIMFGSIEHSSSWTKHILATRDLQSRTMGFTEFVPLPFVHMASPIFLMGKSRKGPTIREAVLMHAVGRIAYHRFIDNIQASWVKMGPSGARLLLNSGANDLGGTLIEENISHAAGSEHGRSLDIAGLRAITDSIERPLWQRNTLYEVLDHHPEVASSRPTNRTGSPQSLHLRRKIAN